MRTDMNTHRIFALVLTVTAGLTFDALPPQSFDSHRELWGELETGRVAWGHRHTHQCHTHTNTHYLSLSLSFNTQSEARAEA